MSKMLSDASTFSCSMADAFFFDLGRCLNQTPQNNDEGGA